MKRPPYRDIVWLFVASRFLLVMVTYFGYILLTAPKYTSTPVDLTGLLSSWNHWDAANYVRIAQHGYQSIYDTAFFPLFPLLIAAIAFPFGSWGYIAAGMLISNLAFLGAMFVLYQLAADVAGEQAARRTLLYLAIFPTAFFFFAAYNESLFILLAAGSLLAMRRQQWLIAGLLGCLASLARSAGPILILPYLYELWLVRDSWRADIKKLLFSLGPVVLIPLGTAIYALYCWKITGSPLAFASVQDHWARHLNWPWQGFVQSIYELFIHQPFGSFFQAHIILDFGATIAFIALLIIGRSWIRTSYSLWAAVLFFYILLAPSTGQRDALISNQRFVLELFPAFIVLAILGLKYPRLHHVLMMLFPALLATLGILFVMNRWMV
ncbi:MAG TPA: mannosyltransferase family protein [Ktedonobacteraceae bacterium]|jgi:Gpi18-like mannosyltransferase